MEDSIELQAIGIDEGAAALLRAKFASFEDWNDPAMDFYNNYDHSRSNVQCWAKDLESTEVRTVLTNSEY